MAKIEELINEIANERLRDALLAEVKTLKETVPFGLVFEEHLPERVRLPNVKIRPGELVSERGKSGNDVWRVTSISGDVAQLEREKLEHEVEPETTKKFVGELVVVRSFGEAIYPALIPVDRVERGGPDKPWHVLINADNFHALQLLLYCYEGNVDVIYIDPPYNSGARDWKYNNDYVDKTDAFRHSKWLSMMNKRLKLAKRLLRHDGVIVITIDENELFHLGILLDRIFPEYLRHKLTIVINPKGAGKKNFARTDEHALFCVPNTGHSVVNATLLNDLIRVGLTEDEYLEELDEEIDDMVEADDILADSLPVDKTNYPFPCEEIDDWELRHARRRGNESSYRHQRPNQFYPIYMDVESKTIEDIGDSIPLDQEPDFEMKDGLLPIWPIDKENNQRCWRFIPKTMRNVLEEGRLVVGRQDSTTGNWTLNIWEQKTRIKKVKTVWWHSRHDAGTHGTTMLHKLLGKRGAFPFPKSLYAVRDTLLTIVADRPNALILDFFAGSGTTLHATALINAQLGGTRRTILVSNNEPGEKAAKKLNRSGFFPGDAEYESEGICDSVTWPRTKIALNGKRDNGVRLKGRYFDLEKHEKHLKWEDGFQENLEYFRLHFLDPHDVARGDAFKSILPILWLMSGAQGRREDSKGSTDWFLSKKSPFAVLIREKGFREFLDAVSKRADVEWLFFVTDSEENFGLMRRMAGKHYKCVQLYKSYLENFQINTDDAMREAER